MKIQLVTAGEFSDGFLAMHVLKGWWRYELETRRPARGGRQS